MYTIRRCTQAASILMVVLLMTVVAGAAEPFSWYTWGLEGDVLPFEAYLAERAKSELSRDITYIKEPIGQLGEKFPVVVGSGVPMDIVQVPFEHAQEWTEAGLLLPLSDYMSKSGMSPEDFIPGSLDPVTKDGKIYAIPTTADFRTLLLNVSLWEQAGLDVNVTKDWDWDTFLNAAQKLHRVGADGQVVQGGYGAPVNQGTWWGWFFANGGQFFNEEGTAAAFNSPEGLESLRFLNELLNQYEVWANRLTGRGHFADGLVAILDNTRFGEEVVHNSQPDMEIRFALYPKGPHGQHPSTRTWMNYHAIPASTQSPNDAWRLLEMYVSPESRAIQAAEATISSPVLEFYRSDAWEQMLERRPERGVWPEILQAGKLEPLRARSFWESETNRLIAQAITGDVSPEEALSQSETIVNAALKQLEQ